jgi:hypothetical protein
MDLHDPFSKISLCGPHLFTLTVLSELIKIGDHMSDNLNLCYQREHIHSSICAIQQRIGRIVLNIENFNQSSKYRCEYNKQLTALIDKLRKFNGFSTDPTDFNRCLNNLNNEELASLELDLKTIDKEFFELENEINQKVWEI